MVMVEKGRGQQALQGRRLPETKVLRQVQWQGHPLEEAKVT